MNSVLKLILYGTRFRINQSYPGNIGSYDLIFQSCLGNIESYDLIFQSYPGNSGSYDPIFQFYPGNSGSYDPIFAPMLMSRGVAGGRGGRRGTAAATAAASQQLSHLARALDHHAQEPNIPFGVNPSLR